MKKLDLNSADLALLSTAIVQQIAHARNYIGDWDLEEHPHDVPEYTRLINKLIQAIRTWNKFAEVYPTDFDINRLPTLDAQEILKLKGLK